jgi:hypothetical protein
MNQSYRPDVILNPQHQQQHSGNALGVPEFGDLAAGVDRMAKQVPWWVWLAGGAALMWYLSKGRSKTIKLG